MRIFERMQGRNTVGRIVLTATAILVGCQYASEPRTAPTLALRDTTLLVDEKLVIPVAARGTESISPSSIAFASSAPSVISLRGPDTVIALGPGTATLTATLDGVATQVTVTVAPQFTQLATGELHACGITARGDLYCWGSAFYGETGPPSGTEDCIFGPYFQCSAVPVRVPGIRPVEIVAGDMHTCALDADGAAYCWGANFYGQTGTGSEADVPLPTAVVGGHRFTHLVAGRMHTCGITTSRDAYCWGWDWTGALGAGDVSPDRCDFFGHDPCSPTPRLVVGGHQWAQLTADDRATCGVTTTHQLYCWGLDVGGDDGQYCQVPDNFSGCTRTPLLIASATASKAISIGDVHRCEQALDGTLECWGANYWGMFGDGTVNSSPTPVPAAGGARYASLMANRTGTCALAEDRHAQCWGYGGNGAIGNGAFDDALSPADVSGGYRFLDLASSGSSDFVCGVAATGRAYCWGWGDFGQLGNGAFLSSSEPVPVRLVPTP